MGRRGRLKKGNTGVVYESALFGPLKAKEQPYIPAPSPHLAKTSVGKVTRRRVSTTPSNYPQPKQNMFVYCVKAPLFHVLEGFCGFPIWTRIYRLRMFESTLVQCLRCIERNLKEQLLKEQPPVVRVPYFVLRAIQVGKVTQNGDTPKSHYGHQLGAPSSHCYQRKLVEQLPSYGRLESQQ